MGRLPKKEEEKRLRLYNEGLPDTEIAKKCYVSRGAIKGWRKRRGLEANLSQGESFKDKKEHKERMKYYNQGLTDREIGKKVGLSKSGVAYWRRQYNLPANREVGDNDGQGGPSISQAEHNARLHLWKEGLTDREIAKKRGVTHTAIGEWRRKNDLDNSKRLTKEQRRRFRGALGLDEYF